MRRLVALDLDGGPAFVEVLLRVWDAGDAALPIDRRLSARAADDLVHAMGAIAVVDEHDERTVEGGRPVEDGDALVVATSGSTGDPKGVVLTHHAVAASARASHARLGVMSSDHWLACLPLSHVGGLSVVTRALLNEIPLTVLPRFDAQAVTEAAHHGATLTSLVATTLRRIDPGLFRCIVLGGGPAPADRPANAVTTYGLTETGSGVVYDGVPLDGVELEIAGDGEILIRCPMMLRGYRDGSSPIDSSGWLHTDDVGGLGDDGRLHVDGRRGDLIITGGENVWPSVVEAALADHPLITEVAIAGIEDPEWGQRVAAWVVPTDRTRPPTVESVRDHVRDRLPAFMAPRSVEIVDELPRTGLGKVRRNRLSHLADRPEYGVGR